MNHQIDRRLFVTRLASGLCAALFLPKLVVPGWKASRVIAADTFVVDCEWVSMRIILQWWYCNNMTQEKWMQAYEDMIKKQTPPGYVPTDEQTSRRNAEARQRIAQHPKLKAQSRAYQEGGAFYGRAEDGGGLVEQLYRKSE